MRISNFDEVYDFHRIIIANFEHCMRYMKLVFNALQTGDSSVLSSYSYSQPPMKNNIELGIEKL